MFEFNEKEDLNEQILHWYDAGKPQSNFKKVYHMPITQYLVWEYAEIDQSSSEPGRWSQFITNIIDINGRHFAVYWERGLTELQENYYDYDDEIHEVKKRIKFKRVVEWIEK